MDRRDSNVDARRRESRPAPRGSPWLARHGLAVVTLGVLALFLLAILTLIAMDVLYLLRDVKAGGPGAWLAEAGRTLYDLFAGLFRSGAIADAMVLSAYTSFTTLLLVVLFCVPIGYALSRYRFPGHSLANTAADLPLVVPPVVIGLSLLVFFTTAPGRWAEGAMNAMHMSRYAAAGIILCQFILSVPFAIRSSKSAFDAVDPALEDLARTLGCSRAGAFLRVALPLAANGIAAGCIMAWARAVGLFGPLVVFVGCVRHKSEVLPTTIYLEVSTGGIDVALAVAMVMFALAGAALVVVHALLSGRRGWEP